MTDKLNEARHESLTRNTSEGPNACLRMKRKHVRNEETKIVFSCGIEGYI